jgi:hypothetical protein
MWLALIDMPGMTACSAAVAHTVDDGHLKPIGQAKQLWVHAVNQHE